MSGNDEEQLRVECPVAVPGTGQKVAGAGRDVLMVIGIGLLFSSFFSLIDGFVWLLFVIIAGAGMALMEGAFLLNRVMRRIEGKGKR